LRVIKSCLYLQPLWETNGLHREFWKRRSNRDCGVKARRKKVFQNLWKFQKIHFTLQPLLEQTFNDILDWPVWTF